MKSFSFRRSVAAWKDEAGWFLAGGLLAGGVLVGFILFPALALALFGATLAASLFVRRRPGRWAFPTGAAATSSILYFLDVMGGGMCPFSSLVFPGESALLCGPPDVLRVLLFFLAGTGVFALTCVRSHRRRSGA